MLNCTGRHRLNLNKQWVIFFPLVLMTLCGKLPTFASFIAKWKTLKNINFRIHGILAHIDIVTLDNDLRIMICPYVGFWHPPVAGTCRHHYDYVPNISCCQCASSKHAHPMWIQHGTQHRYLKFVLRWIRVVWQTYDIKWTVVSWFIKDHRNRWTSEAHRYNLPRQESAFWVSVKDEWIKMGKMAQKGKLNRWQRKAVTRREADGGRKKERIN